MEEGSFRDQEVDIDDDVQQHQHLANAAMSCRVELLCSVPCFIPICHGYSTVLNVETCVNP